MIFIGSNGSCTAEFTVNDSTLAVESVHVVNNGTKPQTIDFFDTDGSTVKFTSTFGPGTDTVRNIPPGQQITAFQHTITKHDGTQVVVTEFLYRFGDVNAAQSQKA